MFKKLLCAILSISLISCITASAAAVTMADSEEPYVVSVTTYPEITDEEELLELAVEQYKAKAVSYSAFSSVEPTEEETDIVAKQVLKEEVYSDGSVVQDVAVTNLGVTDQEGRQVNATWFNKEYDRNGGSNAFSVFGSMTVYASQTYPSSVLENPIGRITKIRVSAHQGTSAYSCSKIEVWYYVQRGGDALVSERKNFYSPQNGVNYYYYPTNQESFLLYAQGGPTEDFYSTYVKGSSTFYTTAGYVISLKAILE